MADTTRAREASENGVREELGVLGREWERLEWRVDFRLGDLDDRGFSILIGAEVQWRFWRKKNSVPSSQPSAMPSRESEEPIRWPGEDAGLDLSPYGVRQETPVMTEA